MVPAHDAVINVLVCRGCRKDIDTVSGFLRMMGAVVITDAELQTLLAKATTGPEKADKGQKGAGTTEETGKT